MTLEGLLSFLARPMNNNRNTAGIVDAWETLCLQIVHKTCSGNNEEQYPLHEKLISKGEAPRW